MIPDGRAWSRITARAPVRIDFGGGWTDVPPFPEERGGFVTSIAIATHVAAVVTRGTGEPTPTAAESALLSAARARFPDVTASVALHTDVPVGSGLGGSSAASVAVLAALHAASDTPLDGRTLAERSRRFEVDDLGIAGGWQDHYSAAIGGALAMRFGRRHHITSLSMSPQARESIERSLLLYYTGASRLSAATITSVRDAYRRRDPGTCAALDAMRQLAEAMSVPLQDGDAQLLGSLVGEHWLHQKALHPSITTPLIDSMISTALRHGAYGAKALGASGGGCLIIIAPPSHHSGLRRALDQMGQWMPAVIDTVGCQLSIE
jgi:D-glycero-alpha-D-manno-heptose-7-phosphate kinase